MPELTVAAILKYKPQKARREIADSRAKGLYLVIQPSGKKTWAVRLRRPDGRPAKLTLGPVDAPDIETSDDPVHGAALTLGQARELAAKIDRERNRGVDVVEQRKAEELRKNTAAADRATNTFAAAVREFFIDYRTAKRQTRPRRWRDDAALLGLRYPPGCSDPAKVEPGIIKGGLTEVWATKPVAEIDDHDVHTVVTEARKHGSNGRARKMHGALSVLFGWLKRQRRITTNPMRELERPRPPASRERRLSDVEIVTFWKATDAVGGTFGAMFKMLLVTGCRLREVAGMRRAELSKGDATWTIPGSRTKNHNALSLPLPKLALDVIASVPVIESKAGLVFTTNGKTPVSGFGKAKLQLDAAMVKVAAKAIDEPWRIHDLRRTFASGLAALGVPLPVTEKLLNHTSGSFGGVVGVYQRHEYATEKAEALQRWVAHVEGLVADKPSNVSKLSDNKRRRR